MALRPYDPVGAMGGLFAPALIRGDPISEAVVEAWNRRNRKYPPKADSFAPPALVPDEEVDNPDYGYEDDQQRRDAIARALLSGNIGSEAGIEGGYPLDPNLDPNPHTTPIDDVAPPPGAPKGYNETVQDDNAPPSAPPSRGGGSRGLSVDPPNLAPQQPFDPDQDINVTVFSNDEESPLDAQAPPAPAPQTQDSRSVTVNTVPRDVVTEDQFTELDAQAPAAPAAPSAVAAPAAPQAPTAENAPGQPGGPHGPVGGMLGMAMGTGLDLGAPVAGPIGAFGPVEATNPAFGNVSAGGTVGSPIGPVGTSGTIGGFAPSTATTAAMGSAFGDPNGFMDVTTQAGPESTFGSIALDPYGGAQAVDVTDATGQGSVGMGDLGISYGGQGPMSDAEMSAAVDAGLSIDLGDMGGFGAIGDVSDAGGTGYGGGNAATGSGYGGGIGSDAAASAAAADAAAAAAAAADAQADAGTLGGYGSDAW